MCHSIGRSMRICNDFLAGQTFKCSGHLWVMREATVVLKYRYHGITVGNSLRLQSERMAAESTGVKGVNIAVLEHRMYIKLRRRLA